MLENCYKEIHTGKLSLKCKYDNFLTILALLSACKNILENKIMYYVSTTV